MSTRSAIGIINEDDTVTAVYCHYDGYLMGVGDTLYRYYTDATKVDELLSHGNISSLGREVGVKHDFNTRPASATTYYSRDRGDGDQEAVTYESIEEFERACDYASYYYLFDSESEAWIVRAYDSDEYQDLSYAIRSSSVSAA